MPVAVSQVARRVDVTTATRYMRPGMRATRTVAVGSLVCAVLLAACAHRLTPRWKTLPELAPMPAARAGGMAPVNGIALYYAIYGHGAPLVLLHGGLANADYWSEQISAFAPTHTL